MFVLHHLVYSSPASTLENPYFFCECTGSDEPSWYNVATYIAESLNEAGAKVESKPQELPANMQSELFGEYTAAVIGLNSRSRAERLSRLGWEPKEKDCKRSYVEDELPEILKEDNSGFAGYRGLAASGAK